MRSHNFKQIFAKIEKNLKKVKGESLVIVDNYNALANGCYSE
jgi:hypothetical protein